MKNPVPRFRRRNGGGKNPDSQGVKSGDFFAPFAKKYDSSLDSLDRRNGHRTLIACDGKMCYTCGGRLTAKSKAMEIKNEKFFEQYTKHKQSDTF